MPGLVVATSWPVHPPRGGGQVRVLGLYGALARLGVEIRIIALVPYGERGGEREIASGVREIRVPQSTAHARAERELDERAGIPTTDIALARHWPLTPAYGDALATAASDAAAVVTCHPFAQPVIAACTSAPLIYESQDVELDLKESMLAESEAVDDLIETVRDVESACCATARHVTVCSEIDGRRMAELYGLESERVVVVPNGIDPFAFSFTPPALRSARRAALRMDDRPDALFLGSSHKPNLAAVRDILAAAGESPDRQFLIVGSAGLPFGGEPLPGNVDVCGVVADGFVRDLLGVVDVALNPMRFGSGTNLKMLSYALAGVPIVSTELGARGLGMAAGEHYVATDADRLADALATLESEPQEAVAARVTAAHRVAGDDFAWDAIAQRWHEHPALRDLLDPVPAAR